MMLHGGDADCADGETVSWCSRELSISYQPEADVKSKRRRSSVGNFKNYREYVVTLNICNGIGSVSQEGSNEGLLPIMLDNTPKPFEGTIRRTAGRPDSHDYNLCYDGTNLTTKPDSLDKTKPDFNFKLEIYYGTSSKSGNSYYVATIKPQRKSLCGEEMIISADAKLVKAVNWSTSGVREVINSGIVGKEKPNPCIFVMRDLHSRGKSAALETLFESCLGQDEGESLYLGVDKDGKLELMPKSGSPEEDNRLHFWFRLQTSSNNLSSLLHC